MDNYLFLARTFAAALVDIAFAGAVGLNLASFLVAAKEGNVLPRRPLRLCSATMLAMIIAQIYLTTATMIASSSAAEVLPQLRSVALETHAGRSLLASAILALALLVIAFLPRPRWPVTVILFLLTASRATIGHAASDGAFTLAEFVQFAHLLSVAIWAGLILAASFLILQKVDMEAIAQFMRRLSITVTVSLGVILASGVYNSYRGLGGALVPLLHTQWGILLCIKLAFIAAALILGLLNRRILHRNAELSQPQIAQLARQMRWEAVLMIAILTLSAALGNSPPAA